MSDEIGTENQQLGKTQEISDAGQSSLSEQNSASELTKAVAAEVKELGEEDQAMPHSNGSEVHESLIVGEVNQDSSNAEILVSNDIATSAAGNTETHESAPLQASTAIDEVNEDTPNAEPLVSNNVISASEKSAEEASETVATVNEDTTNAEVLVSNNVTSANEISSEQPSEIVASVNEDTTNAEALVSNNVTSTEKASDAVENSLSITKDNEVVEKPMESQHLDKNQSSSTEHQLKPNTHDQSTEDVPTFLEEIASSTAPAVEAGVINEPTEGYQIKTVTREVSNEEDDVALTRDESKIVPDATEVDQQSHDPSDRTTKEHQESKPENLAAEEDDNKAVADNADVRGNDPSVSEEQEARHQVLDEEDNVPTFIDEIQASQEAHQEDESINKQVNSDNADQRQASHSNSKPSNPSSQVNNEQQNANDDYSSTGSEEEIAEKKDISSDKEIKQDVKKNENENELPTFLDEIEQKPENKEDVNEVPTFLDEIKQTSEERQDVNEVPTFLEEIKQNSEEKQDNNEVPTFLDEIQDQAGNTDTFKSDEKPNIEQSTTDQVNLNLKEDAKMFWEQEPVSSPAEVKKADPFDFLQDTTAEDTAINDDSNSNKSFSFLEDDFEPLLEDETKEQVTTVSPIKSPASQISAYSSRYQPIQQPLISSQGSLSAAPSGKHSHASETKSAKPFFEELPSISSLSSSKLTTSAKSNPYAPLVRHSQPSQHQQQQAPGVTTSKPPPAVVAPPKNPYAPSQQSLQAQQEKLAQPAQIPQPFTAKDSISQSANLMGAQSHQTGSQPVAPIKANPPPTQRISSRTSSIASKSFFEELPVAHTPASALPPKNPYAPMVHQQQAPPFLKPAAPPSNPYGIAPTSNRKLSSASQHQMMPPSKAPGPMGPPGTVPAVNGPQTYSRSRASSYLPANTTNMPQQTLPQPQTSFSPSGENASVYGNASVPGKKSRYAPDNTAMVPPASPSTQNASKSYAPNVYSPQHAPASQVQGHARQFSASKNNNFVPPPVPRVAPYQAHQHLAPVQPQFDNFQVPANIEISRQFPIFRFHRTKKVAKLSKPGTVDIIDVETVTSLSELDQSFAPLSKLKTKKAAVEGWIAEKLADIAVHGHAEYGMALAFTILKELITGDGQLKSFETISAELAKTVTVHFPQGSSFFKQPANSKMQHASNDSLALGLFNFLFEGKKDDGLQYLLSQKEWPLSFVVASMVGPEATTSVINQYLFESFATDKNSSSYALYFALSIISGNSSTIVSWLAKDDEAFNYVIMNFSVILSLILKNSINSSIFFFEFGSLLVDKGRTILGHCLFMLAQAPLSDLEIRPGVVFSVVGADPLTDKGYHRSIDVMTMTEIYEYALSLASVSTVPSLGYPHLLPLKVSHAALLVDHGCFASAVKYTDLISTNIRAAGKSVRINPSLAGELEEIITRTGDTGESGWFGSRPKIIGILDKGFSKFIAGEDTAPKPDSDGLFTNYSPSVSRTQSVADFSSSAYNQAPQRPAYTHTKSFMGLDSAPLASTADRGSAQAFRSKYSADPTIPVSDNASYFPPSSDFATVAPAAIPPQTSTANESMLPPSVYGQYAPKSPSAKSDFIDDIADIRSSISAVSNRSKYAPVPHQSKPAAIQPMSQIPVMKAEIDEKPPSNYAPSVVSQNSVGRSPVMKMAVIANSSNVAPPPETSIPPETASPSLPKKNLTYETPVFKHDVSQSMEPISGAIADETASDIYGATPSKPGIKMPAKVPANPYAMHISNRPKRNNRYAPSASGSVNSTSLLETTDTAEVDIYSYGGYARPLPGQADSAPAVEAEPTRNQEPIAGQAPEMALYNPPEHIGGHVIDEPTEEPANIYAAKPSVGPYDTSNSSFTPYEPPSFSAPVQRNPSYVPPSNESFAVDTTNFDDAYDDDVVEDDDDDDDQEAIAAAAAAAAEAERKKKEDEARRKREAAEEEKRKKEAAGKGGWFGGIFGSATKEAKNKDDKKVYKAKLGEESHFYYDEKLKRWVNKNAADDVDDTATPPPPPPPTVKVPKRASDTPAPPSAIPGPPKSGPPAFNGGMSSSASGSSSPAPAPASSIVPPPGLGARNMRTPSHKSVASDIDDLLGMAATTRSTGRSKRGPRRGYVDVMNKE